MPFLLKEGLKGCRRKGHATKVVEIPFRPVRSCFLKAFRQLLELVLPSYISSIIPASLDYVFFSALLCCVQVFEM